MYREKIEMIKMYCVIALAVIVCALLITSVFRQLSIRLGKVRVAITYWMITLLGAVALLVFNLLPFKDAVEGLTASGGINPIKILILFISMTTLSVFLDEAGLFSYLACVATARAKGSQIKLFLTLFLLVSVLTVFTSNDIIILTFTPFICYFCKKAGINPMPYLFGEFVAANTWSMMLIIGNPTNIYLGACAGITFGAYVARMFIPTMFAGIVALLLLLLIFRRNLKQPMRISEEAKSIKDRGLVIIGVIHLVLCTILLVLSSYLNFEMWYVTLAFAVSLFVSINIYKKIKRSRIHILHHTLSRAPWELIPFVISMFLLVLGLEKYGVTEQVANLLGTDNVILKYGIASFLSANVMNNIPMSVAFSSIVSSLSGSAHMDAVYAAIVGSNIGAYFTPLGALAGIMWAGILSRMGIDFSFKKYVSYGVRISIPVLFAALLGLML